MFVIVYVCNITINTSGFIASGKRYAIYNHITANINISRARIIVKDTASRETVYNNGTKLNPSSAYIGTSQFTYHTITSANVIVSATYQMENLYVHRRGWQTISNYTYYYKDDGTKKTEWLKLDGKWYYLVPTANWNGSTIPLGARLQGGQFTINGTVRKFDANGVCTNPPS